MRGPRALARALNQYVDDLASSVEYLNRWIKIAGGKGLDELAEGLKSLRLKFAKEYEGLVAKE
jgi:hypothetical protein